MALVLLTVAVAVTGLYTASTLSLSRAPAAAISGDKGVLTLTAPRCTDRTNWCVPWKNMDCTKGSGNSGHRIIKSVDIVGGHSISLYQDGLLSFESPTCIRVEQSIAPVTKDSGTAAQITFGSSQTRIRVDADNNLWIQAPKIQDGHGVAMVAT